MLIIGLVVGGVLVYAGFKNGILKVKGKDAGKV